MPHSKGMTTLLLHHQNPLPECSTKCLPQATERPGLQKTENEKLIQVLIYFLQTGEIMVAYSKCIQNAVIWKASISTLPWCIPNISTSTVPKCSTEVLPHKPAFPMFSSLPGRQEDLFPPQQSWVETD